MTEFELKFQVPDARVADVEAALRRGTAQRQRLRARYYDTPAEDLARHGIVLRLRQEGRQWVQTAKARGNGSFERLEHDAQLPARSAAGRPDPARHAGHPVEDLLQDALRGAQELQPVYETDVTRLARVIEAAGTEVEVALDRGKVQAGPLAHPVQEVEFELKRGSPTAAIELAQSWCREYGLWIDPQSKAALGRRLAAGDPPPPPVQAAPHLAQPKSAAQLLAGVLSSALDQALGNAREIAAGTGRDEHVHQLRVGLRRLRTALRELDDVPELQGLDPATAPALRDLFGVLGTHRDLSTLVPALAAEIVADGGPDLAWQPKLPDIGSAVRAPTFQAALLELVALSQRLQAEAERDAGGLKATRKTVRERLRKLHRQVERDGDRFRQLAEPERHRVRKRLKRLRYLSELMRPLFDGAAVDAYVKGLKGLQDALGLYQDAATGRRLLEERAEAAPQAWFGAGWLARREHEIAAECEQACRKSARKARPFW